MDLTCHHTFAQNREFELEPYLNYTSDEGLVVSSSESNLLKLSCRRLQSPLLHCLGVAWTIQDAGLFFLGMVDRHGRLGPREK